MRMRILTFGAGLICLASTQSTFTQAPASAVAPAVTSTPAPTVANVAMPALTAEEQKTLAAIAAPGRLAAIRARLHGDAQRAVRDGAEQAFREPTADEAAVLAAGRGAPSGVVVSVAGGGVALKADASSLEFVKATVDDAGVVVSADRKGARRDQ